MKEIWKPVVGYEGYYEVSNIGRVKSVFRVTPHRDGYHFVYERILKQSKLKNGYCKVGLCRDGVRKNILIHRMVAEAFIPNPDNLPCINHRDESRDNNSVWNLEWCTYQYNLTYGHVVEKRKAAVSKPILQIDSGGRVVKRWNSVNDCIRGGYYIVQPLKTGKKYKNHKWVYENEYAN